MTYFVRFKDDRPSIRVSDEQAVAIADAKDDNRQVEIGGSFFDTAMIAEIVSQQEAERRGQVNHASQPTERHLGGYRWEVSRPVIKVKDSGMGYEIEEAQRNRDGSIAHETVVEDRSPMTKEHRQQLRDKMRNIRG